MYNQARGMDTSGDSAEGIGMIENPFHSRQLRNDRDDLYIDGDSSYVDHMVYMSTKSSLDRFRLNREWCTACYQDYPALFGAMIMFLVVCIPFIIALAIVASGKASISWRWISDEKEDPWSHYVATSSQGMVATDVDSCSSLGIEMLQLGGNAIDAAIAATLCLGVLSPASSGIGGGAFILFHNATTGTTRFFDSRETAPAAASPSMFDADPMLSQNGGLAIGVFAELKGLYELHQQGGSLDWYDVVMPVSEIAKSWRISAELDAILKTDEISGYLRSGQYPELSAIYVSTEGNIKSEGDLIEQETLSNTLKQIALHGSDYIYSTMATVLSQEIQDNGGIVTEQDISSYNIRESIPVKTEIMGHTMYSASGSSSGGVCLSGISLFMESYEDPLVSQGLIYNHRLTEAMKHTFAIRMNLGDPDYVNVSDAIDALQNKTYMNNLRKITSDDGVLSLGEYGGKFNIDTSRRYLPEDHGTTHLSVIDSMGNTVAITSTVNTYFGSKVVSNSTGIVFNNQMDDFSNQNASNYFGLHPSSLNYPEGGKRPLSSMSPMILLSKENGKVRMTGGASGGPRIITATVQVLLNYMSRGMDLLSAVKAPRLHAQLLPDLVYVEDHTLVSDDLEIKNADEVNTELEILGHTTTWWGKSMGVSQYIAIDPDTQMMTGVSDPRKNGRPCGL